MIHSIAKATAGWLIKSGAVTEEDAPAYEYVVYRAIFTVIPLLMTFVIATLMKMTVEGLLMIIPFILIRRFCGGLHLNSSAVCFILSTITLVVALFIIRMLINYEMASLALAMAIASTTSIKSSSFVSKGKECIHQSVKSTVYDCTGRVHRFPD